MTHDHALDGMLDPNATLTARDLRLHLDDEHDARTTGWYFSDQIALHAQLHDATKAPNLSANPPADPPGRRRVRDRQHSPAAPFDDGTTALYLTDANGTVYLAEIAGVVGGPLWRLHEATS